MLKCFYSLHENVGETTIINLIAIPFLIHTLRQADITTQSRQVKNVLLNLIIKFPQLKFRENKQIFSYAYHNRGNKTRNMLFKFVFKL